MSTMTTEFAAPVSRTQMNFSLSIVRLVKEMHAGLTPALVSCKGWWERKGQGTTRSRDRVPFSSRAAAQAEMQGEETGHAITRTDTTSLTVTGGVAMVPCRSTSGGNPPCAAGDFRSQRAFARADPTAAERKQACAPLQLCRFLLVFALFSPTVKEKCQSCMDKQCWDLGNRRKMKRLPDWRIIPLEVVRRGWLSEARSRFALAPAIAGGAPLAGRRHVEPHGAAGDRGG